jgi:hypothetical protein
MASFLLTVAPLPAFMLFGKPHEEKMKKLDSISYVYLLSGLISNGIWTAYGYDINNYDIIITSVFGNIFTINNLCRHTHQQHMHNFVFSFQKLAWQARLNSDNISYWPLFVYDTTSNLLKWNSSGNNVCLEQLKCSSVYCNYNSIGLTY